MTYALVLAVIVLFFPIQLVARTCPPSIVSSKNEAFVYVSNLVSSFGLATDALKENEEQSSKMEDSSNAVEWASNWMLALKRANDSFECAATMLAKFTSNRDESIKTSAMAATVAYRQNMTLNTELITGVRQLLDGRVTRQGSQADKLSDNSLKRDEAWRMLINATVLATYSLVVVPSNENETLSTISLTTDQRAELSADLERTFGELLGQPLTGMKLAYVSGHMLHEWLNRDWKLQPTDRVNVPLLKKAAPKKK